VRGPDVGFLKIIVYSFMLYLYGASGHAKVILEMAQMQGFMIGGLVDTDPGKTALMNFKVSTAPPADDYDGNTFVVSIGNNKIRKQVAESEELRDAFFEVLIHPAAAISPSAEIGDGTVVMAGAVVNADVRVGRHAIINTGASVDHDCVLEDFVHVSPGAALAGDVKVGEGSHVGIGASVIQGVRIGRWCTVGAGAVVIRDVPDGATVVGVPARAV